MHKFWVAFLILLFWGGVACSARADPTPTSDPSPRLRVTVREALVFAAPNREAEIVFRLIEGDTLPFTAQTEPDLIGVRWYQVAQGERFGWLAGSQVEVLGAAEGVREVAWFSQTAVPSPTATPENTPTLIPPSPTLTPTAPPTAELSPTPASPSPTAYATQNLLGTAQAAPSALPPQTTPSLSPTTTGIPGLKAGVPPPIRLPLPADWQAAHVLVTVNSLYMQGDLPVSIYQGRLGTDVLGTLWVIWGFPNVTTPSGELNPYADGVQLLRGLVYDASTCRIGLGGEQRTYNVGGFQAIGTIYSVVGCADGADAAGFFAVLEVGGGSFAFFASVEPPTATNSALPQLSAVLEAAQFELE